MNPSDHELWQQVRRGNAEALGLLFERHGQSVYGYCFRLTGDSGAADELLSATFLEVWQRRGAMRTPDDVRAWLFGVATNLARNNRRALRRYRDLIERLPRLLPEQAFIDDVAEIAIKSEEVREVLETLSKLPRREREATLLVWCQGLSIEEASDALGVRPATLRTRLHRARNRLRSDFELSTGQWRLASDE